jgi:hypothetical protein
VERHLARRGRPVRLDHAAGGAHLRGRNVGLHALNGRGDAIADTFIEDLLDSTAAGLALLGGAEYELAPRLRVYGELRYTLLSDVRYPGIRLGAALMLPGARGGEQTGGK